MKRTIGFVVTLALGASGIFACTGDDSSTPAPPGASDGGTDATTQGDAALPFDSAPPSEAASDASTDAGGPFLLLTYAFDGYAKSEYAAVDLGAGAVRGHFDYVKYGTNMSTARSPWVLNQHGDVVMKMDPAAPWSAIGAWSVAEPMADAGGSSISDPWSIAETATKAYVALFDRNVVPVIDTTTLPLDGGAPAKVVDLSSLVQANDTDGYVDAIAAIYDDARKRVWVVLGNVDLNDVDPQGFFALCTDGLASTVVAIDVTNDTIVAGTTYTLQGVDPSSVAYDVAGDRLVIESAGCNEKVDGGDAGKGPMKGRVIESVSLASGQSTLLYDANAQPFPGPMEYVDAHHAYVQFGSATYAWDPASTSLGATIANAPDAFVVDATGKLVGPKTTYAADGGVQSIDVVAVDPADGGTTKLAANPVTTPDPAGYFEGVDLWPHP